MKHSPMPTAACSDTTASTSPLPTPNKDALAHSQRLLDSLVTKIETHGPMRFESFMQQCLYAPELGYYSGGSMKFGSAGDFITAPMVSPLFGYCIARQCQMILKHCASPTILELGAGTGQLCVDVLTALQADNALPEAYWILEVSGELRQRQRETIAAQKPELLSRVTWLDRLPEQPFEGVILGNEVLDALPAQLIEVDAKQAHLKNVGLLQTADDTAQPITPLNPPFTWQRETLPSSSEDAHVQGALQIAQHIRDQHRASHFSDDQTYLSEYVPMLPGFIASLSDVLQRGVMLFIDYGYARQEYYHPDRHMGTLMCHYRHHAHTNPLILPGLQDITAHVDFTAVADNARAQGLRVAGYATQAAFLMGCGLVDILQQAEAGAGPHTRAIAAMRKAVQTLTHPHEMGEFFKVIALSRDIAPGLMGFEIQNWTDRLTAAPTEKN